MRRSAPLRVEALEGREVPAVFLVTNTSSDPATAGSLPAAVALANSTPGFDRVQFAIPSVGLPEVSQTQPLQTITLAQSLVVTDQVAIEGPGFDNGNPLLTISGGPGVADLIVLQSNGPNADPRVGSTVQNLALVNSTSSAVLITAGSTGNFVQNNYVGFTRDLQGTVTRTDARPAAQYGTAGVTVRSSFNTVRDNSVNGVTTGIVVGETPTAIWSGNQYQTNSVQRNTVGVDPTGATGTGGYGNAGDGVQLLTGAIANFVGPDNTVSNNGGSGVAVVAPFANQNAVFQNRIGTDAVGTVALGNAGYGVLVGNGAAANFVGGPLGGNVISANRLGGAALGTADFPGAAGFTVTGNIIGLNAGQTAVVGTQPLGVYVGDQGRYTANNYYQSNTISQNVIAGHTLHGVYHDGFRGMVVDSNYFGRSAAGTVFANGGFAVVQTAAAYYAYGYGNSAGSNRLGLVYKAPGLYPYDNIQFFS